MRFRLSPIHWFGITGIAIIIFFSMVATLITINDRKKQSSYNNGTQAYKQANCDLALFELNKFLELSSVDEAYEQLSRAKTIKSECNLLNSISIQEQSGKPALGLAASAEFVQLYPHSSLIDPLRQKTTALLAQHKVNALAQRSSCEKLEALIKTNLIPPSNQPHFYQACGQVFEKNGMYSQATAFYEQFLDQFPNHQLTTDVKQDYAQALYDEAQAKGAGTIPPPRQSGSTGDGSTVVEIRNDSPENMRIVFGGPTPRVEELEPCQSCEKFTGAPPITCPSKGPVGRYIVDPGDYQIIVKSISNSTVTPYTGDWSLAANTRYLNCFYIVRKTV